MTEAAPGTYGQRLKQRREACGMSRSGLAERLTRTTDSVRNWERDALIPPKHVRVALAILLNDAALIEAGK